MKKTFFVSLAVLTFFPATALSQATTLHTLIEYGQWFVMMGIKIAMMLAFVVFFWQLAMLLLNIEDEKRVADARHMMFWSVVALFLMVTIWGTIAMLQRTVGPDSKYTVDLPVLQIP